MNCRLWINTDRAVAFKQEANGRGAKICTIVFFGQQVSDSFLQWASSFPASLNNNQLEDSQNIASAQGIRLAALNTVGGGSRRLEPVIEGDFHQYVQSAVCTTLEKEGLEAAR